MDILDDTGASKLSAKVSFFKVNSSFKPAVIWRDGELRASTVILLNSQRLHKTAQCMMTFDTVVKVTNMHVCVCIDSSFQLQNVFEITSQHS